MKNPSKLAQEFMEKGRIESFSVIDAHTHMGAYYGFSIFRPDAKDMIKSMDKYGIEFAISAPHSCLFDPLSNNAEIKQAMKEYPERILGYFSVNPHVPVTEHEIDQAFKENPGFVGIKLLPDYHKARLDSKAYRVALKYANHHGLPVLSHTWDDSDYNGQSYSTVGMIEKVLEEYPGVHFLMGHSVQGKVDEAIQLAISYPNAYLELTDTYRFNGVIERMCRGAGSEKVIYGTDLPWFDQSYGMGCVLFAYINDEEKTNILRNNILRIIGRQ